MVSNRVRVLAACAGIVCIFLVVQLGALALVEPFQQEGHQVVEDTDDPTISIVYIGAILLMTLLVLGAIEYGGQPILRALIVFAGAYIGFFVFQAVLPAPLSVTVADYPVDVLAVALAGVLGLALYLYPEWYVIDGAGIVMGIGAAGLFGVNFGILPALVLLVALAVYDAISVYGTEHMLTLASGVMEMRVPVVLVVPLSLSYSFLDAEKPDSVTEVTGEESDGDVDDGPADAPGDDTHDEHDTDALPDRDALFIGLGDAVIPTVLVASAAFFVDSGPTLSLLGIEATLPAVTAMVGTLAGLVVLLWLVLKGRAHAGLPLLNGGAIAGYLVGAALSGMTIVEALGLSTFL